MKQELKIVLDTNVWISGLIWGGRPAEIITAAEDNRLSILISEEIIAEISRVLNYPKLKDAYQPTGLNRKDLIETIIKIGKIVKVMKKLNVVHEHPADNKFIECAWASKANYLVSGDKHVLRINAYKKTKILTVNDFLRLL